MGEYKSNFNVELSMSSYCAPKMLGKKDEEKKEEAKSLHMMCGAFGTLALH